MNSPITMDDILNSNLGEVSGDIRVIFQKQKAITQFEPELIEVESVLHMDKNISGEERMLLSSMLLAQVEYTGFVELLAKKLVTPEEFNERKVALERDMQAIVAKYTKLTGKEPTEYFK